MAERSSSTVAFLDMSKDRLHRQREIKRKQNQQSQATCAPNFNRSFLIRQCISFLSPMGRPTLKDSLVIGQIASKLEQKIETRIFATFGQGKQTLSRRSMSMKRYSRYHP